jgi:flagellar hook-associated protein 1 FlgK
VINTVNTAQGNGVALDGTAGTAMFTGTGAGDIAIASTTAPDRHRPSGAGANSRDQTNLTAMMRALNTAIRPARPIR